jgi:hypothetical protein
MYRKAILQLELDTLKQQSQSHGLKDSVNVETPRAGCLPQQATAMLPPPPLLSPVSKAYSTASWMGSCENNGMGSLTLPRMLDGREYDAERIDDCFTL